MTRIIIFPAMLKMNSNIHTSSSFHDSKPKLMKMKISKQKSSQMPALCSILEAEEHKTILKEIDKDSRIDIIVGYILEMNIKVQAVALEFNILAFEEGLIHIQKHVFPKNLDPEVKIGKFTPVEDEIIEKNWSALIKAIGLKEDNVIRELFENTRKDKDFGNKRNIVGFYLSQGLTNVRLAAEVFHRAKVLVCARRGEFTKKEDQTILDFREKEGNTWSSLAKVMGRNRNSIIGRLELLNNSNKQKKPFNIEEDKVILTEVFAINEDILNNGKISWEDCSKIGEKLQRSGRSVYDHWKSGLEPLLKRYHAGTHSMDIKELLINHLLEHEMYYTQDVNWKELVKLPKFAGSTPSYLRKEYSNLRAQTKRMKPEMSRVDLDTAAIKRYQDITEKRNQKKRVEYQDKLLDFYLMNVLK